MDASGLDRAFFDTNVLVYAYDDRDQAKRDHARALWDATPAASIVVSAQVIGEFFWTVTRKLGLPTDQARAAVGPLYGLTVVALDTELVRSAIDLAQTASIAYWDALIVAAARRAGCSRVLTEDLNHGQVIDGVRLENPFLAV